MSLVQESISRISIRIYFYSTFKADSNKVEILLYFPLTYR
jgi:hypothetical protein